MAKQYKAGQLLTINGKVYRVKRTTEILTICISCNVKSECFRRPFNEMMCKGVPGDCYLQLVVPKSSLG